MSGRRDSNPGPLAPKASALAGLRYAPMPPNYNRISSRVERWLEEHYRLAFFWFMMALLFVTQVLLRLV